MSSAQEKWAAGAAQVQEVKHRPEMVVIATRLDAASERVEALRSRMQQVADRLFGGPLPKQDGPAEGGVAGGGIVAEIGVRQRQLDGLISACFEEMERLERL